MPLGSASIGFFFGFFRFDFLADFFVFGVFGFAAFAFVVDLFDRDRFVFVLVDFAVVRFGCVFFVDDEQRCRRDRKRHCVRRGRRCEQQQRGEQEDQQAREFPHAPLIGVRCRTS